MAKKKNFSGEIALPEGVSADYSKGAITIKSKNGETSRKIGTEEIVSIEVSRITIQTKKSTKSDKKMIGSVVAHIKNMVKGVTEGHKYVLKICSGHFPMSVSINNNQLVIKNFFGEKVPRVLKIRQGARVTVEGEHINVESIDKETVSQVSAGIEQLTRRPGFDTRVFQDGCYIISKDGRELK